MIRYENATREIPFGRYTQRFNTRFAMRTLPDWLSSPVAAESRTWENNGLTLNDGNTETTPKLVTAYFDVEQMTQISLELFNVNFGTSANAVYFALASENGGKAISLAASTGEAKTILSYHADGGVTSSPAFSDEDVGFVGTVKKFRFNKDNQGIDRYADAPRNIRLAIFPVEREIAVLENGVASYTLNRYIHPDGIDVDSIDFSGRWRFEVYSANYLRLAGAELTIQQNV